jgi:predicted nucleic acid-binding protein
MTQPSAKYLLVLDTWIFATIAEKEPEAWEAIEVLAGILNKCHSIVLDYQSMVMAEYDTYFLKDKWLQDWFKLMQQKRKVLNRPMNQIALNTYVSDDDKKFLSLAISTPDHIIISGDSDFIDKKDDPDFVSRHIKVFTVKEARRWL